MSSFRCHQDVCWFCFEGSRASPIQYPVIRNTSWLEYQQKRSCRFLQKYTFSLLQVYNFFKLNIFFQTYKLIIFFFFQKKFRHKCIAPQCGRIAIRSLGCVSACTHCCAHSEWYVKGVAAQVALFFFLSFFHFFLFVFLFFDNWECWNLLRLRFITTQTCLILQKMGSRSSVYVGLG